MANGTGDMRWALNACCLALDGAAEEAAAAEMAAIEAAALQQAGAAGAGPSGSAAGAAGGKRRVGMRHMAAALAKLTGGWVGVRGWVWVGWPGGALRNRGEVASVWAHAEPREPAQPLLRARTPAARAPPGAPRPAGPAGGIGLNSSSVQALQALPPQQKLLMVTVGKLLSERCLCGAACWLGGWMGGQAGSRVQQGCCSW